MSEEEHANEAVETDLDAKTPQPRLWPAVIIAVIYLMVLAPTWLFATTNIHYIFGFGIGTLVATLLLLLWWLFASRIRIRERLAGLVLFLAVPVWILLVNQASGPPLLMIVLPALTLGIVGVLVVTQRLPWPNRRRLVLLFMMACAGGFSAVRVDGVQGNVMPVMSWRWSPTPEELLTGEMGLQTKEPGGVADVPAEAGPEDWPGFRGALRDGQRPGVTFATDWDKDPPRELWRRRVGLGWSSFAVIQDYVFTQEQRGTDELVVCYRADTGAEVWINRVETRFNDPMGSGPRGTPTFHEGRLYTLGATGVLQCLDASTGESIWQGDLTKDVDAPIPTWGFASSPLVVGDLAVVFAGAPKGADKGLAAYHRASGEVAWTAGAGNSGYSSAHLATLADTPQILMISNYGIESFDVKNGAVLWTHAWDMGSNERVTQPLVLADEAILIGCSFGKGTRQLRVSRSDADWKVEEGYTSKKFRPYFNDVVLHKGYCYGFDGSQFMCVDPGTGKRRWKGDRLGGQVLLLPDMDMLLVLSEKGEVILFEATPDACREVARMDALDGKTWNHPVVAYGRLFVRNDQEVICYELPS
jgi:outer membrane protein assembly factor BamB